MAKGNRAPRSHPELRLQRLIGDWMQLNKELCASKTAKELLPQLQEYSGLPSLTVANVLHIATSWDVTLGQVKQPTHPAVGSGTSDNTGSKRNNSTYWTNAVLAKEIRYLYSVLGRELTPNTAYVLKELVARRKLRNITELTPAAVMAQAIQDLFQHLRVTAQNEGDLVFVARRETPQLVRPATPVPQPVQPPAAAELIINPQHGGYQQPAPAPTGPAQGTFPFQNSPSPQSRWPGSQ